MKLTAESAHKARRSRSAEVVGTSENYEKLPFDPKREVSHAEVAQLKEWCADRDITHNQTVDEWSKLRLVFGEQQFPSGLLGHNIFSKTDMALHTPRTARQPVLFYLWNLRDKIEDKTLAEACRKEASQLTAQDDGKFEVDVLNLLAARKLDVGSAGVLKHIEELLLSRLKRRWGNLDTLPLALAVSYFPELTNQVELDPGFWIDKKMLFHQSVQAGHRREAVDLLLGLTLLGRALPNKPKHRLRELPPRSHF